MADLATFQMNRAPARAALQEDHFLKLEAGGPFVEALRALLAPRPPEPSQESEVQDDGFTEASGTEPSGTAVEGGEAAASGLQVAEAAQAAARRHLATLPDALRASLDLQATTTPPDSWFLRLLLRLDEWLSAADNTPSPEAFDRILQRQLGRLVDQDEVDLATFDPGPERTTTCAALVDVLCAALLVPERWQTAQRAGRLLLVAGLVTLRFDRCRPFESAGSIGELLQHRRPLLPSPPFPEVLPDKRVHLVRAATVSDLYVVRSEWRCYEAGEVADITNVLAREKLEHKRLSIEERELTDVLGEERVTIEERSDESKDQMELSEETQRQVDLAVHAEGQVSSSGQYGAAKVDSTVGASVDFSVSDAMRRATRVAREAVHRATAAIENRRRTERTERTLTRTEVTDTHSFDNPSPEHVRGVYRWVDRIDRYQVVRYPSRLQLEFQLPEPGNALRRLLAPSGTAALDDPGVFALEPTQIDRASWSTLAARYKVLGISPPPDASVAVSVTVHGSTSTLPKDEAVWNLAPATAKEEIALPPGYEAVHVSISVRADPLLGKFVREYTDSTGTETIERFRSLSVTATVADLAEWHWHPGDHGNTIQPDRTQRKNATAAWQLRSQNGQLTYSVRDKLPVRIVAAGAESVSAAVLVQCALTDAAYQSWRQGVYDLLLAAHQEAQREYREEQARLAMRGASSVRERSPARNQQMVREELRRLVLAWLTDQSPFPGRPAVLVDHPEDTHLPTALEVAADIQFLEQAFEWQNMVYVCYPYYWARTDQWDDLRLLETADPELGQFLRAGSVRVVLPARPSMQCQVEHWLAFRQPWAGGTPPTPDKPAYVSVAQEIRDQLLPPPDGIPGESWEVRLPTPFRWLDASARLPHNPRGVLGLPPNEPVRPLCDHPDGHGDHVDGEE
ncbi:hypothetical protein [Streptomyces fructofermentans]|uniref:hypothetical protein n=1 Tax=Streptomyces fructofermentans TaxID=152141 RepID=UPI0033FB901F